VASSKGVTWFPSSVLSSDVEAYMAANSYDAKSGTVSSTKSTAVKVSHTDTCIIAFSRCSHNLFRWQTHTNTHKHTQTHTHTHTHTHIHTHSYIYIYIYTNTLPRRTNSRPL
jgi:hypothetical protein